MKYAQRKLGLTTITDQRSSIITKMRSPRQNASELYLPYVRVPDAVLIEVYGHDVADDARAEFQPVRIAAA